MTLVFEDDQTADVVTFSVEPSDLTAVAVSGADSPGAATIDVMVPGEES